MINGTGRNSRNGVPMSTRRSPMMTTVRQMQTLDRPAQTRFPRRSGRMRWSPPPGPTAHAHRLPHRYQDDQDAADLRALIHASPPDDFIASIRNRLDAAHSCAEQHDLPVVGDSSDLHGNRAQFLRNDGQRRCGQAPF